MVPTSPRHPARPLGAALLLLGVAAGPAFAEDAPALVEATKGPFAVVLELEGTLDATDAVRVRVDTKEWDGELRAAAGAIATPTRVEKDAVLATFDPEKLDERLEATRRELALATTSLEAGRESARRAEEAAVRELARAKVERERAAEALEYFRTSARAKRTAESELELKGSRDSVSDQEEELDQLKKMYKADDVVEETEKIVMARAERQLLRSRTWLGFRQEAHDRLLKVELPRELEDLEHTAARTAAEHEKARATTPLELEKTRRELAKQELELAQRTRALARLEADRALLVVKAPIAGLCVPGALDDGTWSGGDETTKALRRGDALPTDRVLFTILPGPARTVHAKVPQAHVLDLEIGAEVEVRLAARPGRVTAARLASIAPQLADGKAEVVFDLGGDDARLLPGLSASIRLALPVRPDALTVPEGAVTSKGDRHRVHVLVDGKPVAKEVETGATYDGRTEILAGLDAGTKVLESPPK